MDAGDAAELLTMASAYDNRTPTESAAVAWAAALDDNVTLADAKTILIEHYSTSRDWLMPSDINQRSGAIRAARIDVAIREGEPIAPPESIDPDRPGDEAAWQRAYWRAIGDGHDSGRADELACHAVGVARPQIETSQRPVEALVAQAAATSHVPRRS